MKLYRTVHHYRMLDAANFSPAAGGAFVDEIEPPEAGASILGAPRWDENTGCVLITWLVVPIVTDKLSAGEETPSHKL